MERLKKGDMNALEAIYIRYKTMITAAIHRTSPHILPSDLDELTQDVFIALIQSAPTFDRDKKLKPWLYGIAVNKAAGVKRTGWLHKNLLGRHRREVDALRSATRHSPTRAIEIRQDLAQAFKRLPKEQHEVMILHVVEGFDGGEIAEIMGVNVNTVWTRLHRARKTLTQSLKASYKGAHEK